MDHLERKSNTIIGHSNSEQMLEQQLRSYMKVFQNIADQIGELNERVELLQNAAE